MSFSFSADAVSMQNLKKSVSGQAVAFSEPLDIERMIDVKSGKVLLKTHESTGNTIKSKIVVAPKVAFNADLEFLIYLLAANNVRPKGIVVNSSSSNLILGAVMADIPIIYGLPAELTDFVKTGDKITLDLEKKEVIIDKK